MLAANRSRHRDRFSRGASPWCFVLHLIVVGLVGWGVLTGQSLTAQSAKESLSARQLAEQLSKAMRKEQWDKAIPLAERLVRVDAEDATAQYNFACVLARAGDLDRAVTALGRAAELGFSFMTTFRDDPDLDPIREHPGFAEVAARIKATADFQFQQFKELADASTPLIFGPEQRAKEPGEPEEPLPLLIFLHGRGGLAETLSKVWLPSAEKLDAVVVLPQAFIPLGRGFQWLFVDHAVYRVQHAIEYAAEHYPIDRDRVVVGGFSQGGYVSLVAASRYPELFAGTIAVGACDREGVELERLKALGEGEGGGPKAPDLRLYIGAGSEDRVHPDCRGMAKRYRELGIDVEYRTYDGYGHVFPSNYEWEFDRALRHVFGK